MNLKSQKPFGSTSNKKNHDCERTKSMEALNLIKKSKVHSMKDTDSIKRYADRLLSIANKVQLLGKDFPDERTVQKILDTFKENMN